MTVFAQDGSENTAKLLVMGVGGGGGNAVAHMIEANTVQGVTFVCANTDAQALALSKAEVKLQLGHERTNGLGAGANPEVGRHSAQDDRKTIQQLLEGIDLLFITAGMGGGTGTGAAPVIAEVAREMGVLTVAVVTKPFSFEGGKRSSVAESGLKDLAANVDSLITIPNNKLLSVLGKSLSLLDAFKAANEVLNGAVEGIADLITRPGLINVDFADVKTVMSEMGMAMMGTGSASGEDRAVKATEAAVASPLLDNIDLNDAKGVLVNITSGPNLSIGEFEIVGDSIRDFTSESATVVVGTVIDPEMAEEMKVTVVVTGLGSAESGKVMLKPSIKAKEASPIAQKPALQNDYLDIPTFLRKEDRDLQDV